MRNLLLTLLLAIGILPAFSQQRPPRPKVVITKATPLNVQIGSQSTTLQALIIDTAKISLYELTSSQSGTNNQDSLLLRLTLKSPQPQLFRLQAILDKFGIPAEKRNLRVCIDKVLIDKSEQILADLAYITRVELTTDRYPSYPEELPSSELVINIVTPRTTNIGL